VPASVVFISYASQDAPWKNSFTNKTWFGQQLGSVYVEDYQLGDNLPFGPLDAWLKKEISAAGAIVLIVSKDYIQKEYTLKEWWQSLSEASRQRLVFVPVMIDACAKVWWAEQKRLGHLRLLGDDYAYADFTENGRAINIVTAEGGIDSVTRKIVELARLIRCYLESQEPIDPRPNAAPTTSISAPAPVSAPSPAAAGSQVSPNLSNAARPAVIVLGHPSAAAIKEVAENTRQLTVHLNSANLAPITWNDGWRAAASARQVSGLLPITNILFVQPLGPVDAGDYATSPEAIRKWIEAAMKTDMPDGASGRPPHSLVLWLPSNLTDAAFEAELSDSVQKHNLVLRHDDPSSLATWLNNQVGGADQVDILMLEDLADVRDSRTLRAALHDGFRKIIGEEMNPVPESWPFHPDILVEHLKQVPTDRVIIAIHDLNTGIAHSWHEARRGLEQKLSMIEKATREAGRDDLKFFRSALLVSKSDTLPWVKYPSPSQFENWCLLPFTKKDNALEPKANHANVFRTYLRDWLRESA
jgi:TIR domain